MTDPAPRSSALPTVASGTPFRIASWIGQIIVALILGQTLFFKFTNAPETQVIFEDLGGRPAAIASGVFELFVVVLILIPRTAFFGALGGLLMMLGAIGSHLTILGIAISTPDGGDDGGLLFGMAVAVLLMSAMVALLRRDTAIRRLKRG